MLSSLTRFLAALTALLLGTLSFGSGSAVAHAEGSPGSIAWTVRTALSQYGSDRPKFTYTVKPGQRLTDGIDISNRSRAKITLKIYAADGFTADSGGFDILTPAKPSKAIGAWVTPVVARVIIPAGRQVQIPFTMTVPTNATPGDHLGGIVTVLDQHDGSDTRTVIHRRVGLRIQARVSGELRSQLRIEKLRLHDDDRGNPFGSGRASISYTVHNSGNTVLSGLQKAKFADGLFGLSSRTVDIARLPDLLPGETWDAKASIEDVHARPWVSATVTVTPVITDAAGSASTLSPVTASSRTVSAWSIVLLVGFVVVLVVLVRLVVLLVKRWRRSSKTKVDAKIAVAIEDALLEEKARK